MNLRVVHDDAPRHGGERVLLVMLPGAKAGPSHLVQYGFVRALRERSIPVDVVAVEAHLGYYLERSICDHLLHDVIAPARAAHYQRIWLMGISLGGMGALLYASEHPEDIAGVVVLAPFLAARGLLAEVARAGGLARWQAGAIKPEDDERRLLAWIKTYPPAAPAPAIYVGCGSGDRYAAASAMLAERLPSTQVASIAGGHDWATWIELWHNLLDRQLFSRQMDVPTL